ncbi:MAG: hypothetical protein ACOYBY_08955 [Dermatophilaceae bacterium]
MSSTDPDTDRHTFRQRGSVLLGSVCMLACTGMFLGSLSQTNLAFAGVMAVATCWAFVLLVRPSLQISAVGVHVNNPLRRTTIPWRRVDHCLTRWNLQVAAGERVVTAWAISSSIERPARPGRYGLGLFGRGLDGERAPAPRQGPSALAIAGLVEDGRAQWHEEVAAGLLVDDGHAQLERTWDGLDALLLAAPLALLVAGLLSG